MAGGEGWSEQNSYLGLPAPDHTVPYGTVLFGGAFPGTSCQATIGLSLRDRMCCWAASEFSSSSRLRTAQAVSLPKSFSFSFSSSDHGLQLRG
jgi:hypothetical protein